MPDITVTLNVLVSYSSDLSSVYNALEVAVAELNKDLAPDFHIKLHSGAASGVDPTESQHLHNMDICVGMMRSRFGESAKHPSLDTEKLFRAAVALFDAAPEQLRVMFFFFPIGNVSSVNLGDLLKIQQFQSDLGKRILWKEVADEQFAREFKSHIQSLLRSDWDKSENKWRRPQPSATGGASAKTQDNGALSALLSGASQESKSAEDGDALEDGYFDFIIDTEMQFQNVVEFLSSAAASTQDLGHTLDIATKRLETSSNKKDQIRVINEVAKQMTKHAGEILSSADGLRASYQRAFGSLSGAVQIATEDMPFSDEDRQALKELIETVEGSVNSQETVLEQVKGYRDVIAGLPRATSVFSSAKKKLVSALDEMLAAITMYGELGRKTIGDLKKSHAEVTDNA